MRFPIAEYGSFAEATLHITSILACIGVLISSLEYVTLLPQFGDQGLFSSHLREYQNGSPRLRKAIRLIQSQAFFGIILMIRILAAAYCVFAPLNASFIPLTMLVASQLLIHNRCRYGLEGSDQMTLILLVATWAAAACPAEPVRLISIAFVTAQSCFSYFVSGICKLYGEAWRNGTAVRNVLRTRQNGNRIVWLILRRLPVLGTAATFLVIGFEIAFPMVLMLPTPWNITCLGIGCLFHVTNAVVMGLNGFIWSFIGSYPSVFYCSCYIVPAIYKSFG